MFNIFAKAVRCRDSSSLCSSELYDWSLQNKKAPSLTKTCLQVFLLGVIMAQLKNLCLKYTSCLSDKSFVVAANNNLKVSAKIHFKKEHFAHLTGVEYCVSPKLAKEYSGIKGYNNILDEKITLEKCKNTNEVEYSKYIVRKVEALEKIFDKIDSKTLNIRFCFFDINKALSVVKHKDFNKTKLIIYFEEGLDTYVYMFGEEHNQKGLYFPLSVRKFQTRFVDFLDLQIKYYGNIKK